MSYVGWARNIAADSAAAFAFPRDSFTAIFSLFAGMDGCHAIRSSLTNTEGDSGDEFFAAALEAPVLCHPAGRGLLAVKKYRSHP